MQICSASLVVLSRFLFSACRFVRPKLPMMAGLLVEFAHIHPHTNIYRKQGHIKQKKIESWMKRSMNKYRKSSSKVICRRSRWLGQWRYMCWDWRQPTCNCLYPTPCKTPLELVSCCHVATKNMSTGLATPATMAGNNKIVALAVNCDQFCSAARKISNNEHEQENKG